jgi:membrane peptidoglycan carboxypeptidase
MAQVVGEPAGYGPLPPAVGHPVRAPRRGRHRLRGLLLSLVAGALVAVAAGWVLTPDAAQTAGRVQAMLRSEHATASVGLPDPDRVGQALIATEDSRFWTGIGLDPRGVLRGLGSPLLGHGDAGGATLEQQLAKLAYSQASAGLLGKVVDGVLAVKMDRAYSKDQVLRMYLDAAYFGHGFYGVQDAARGYFAVGPSRLSWGQASMLAGLVQAPSLLDPLEHLAAARARQAHVLDRLVATGVLTRAQARTAGAAPLGLRDQ